MKVFPFLLAVAAALAVSACKPAKTEAAKATPAVQISKKVGESELAIVTLTPEAEKRLGIQTATAERKKTGLARTYGGELILPLGQSPASPAAKADGKSIYSLLPSMTAAELMRAAELQIDADGQIASAKAQLEGAQSVLKRADELLTSKAGSGRTVDEARLQVRLAEVALQTAQEKRALLGTAIFTAAASNRLWVRVPVYVGEINSIKAGQPARVRPFGGDRNAALTATPVVVPYSATTNPLISDLFYEMTGDAGGIRPGTKVEVSLALQGEEESLVVPAAAILYDFHGNTWVYEALADHAYRRVRVEVLRTAGSDAILARGPKPGTQIVTDGSAELFGTEFGAGK
ncbi:MAG: membrane fusion protein MtrC [Opitutaceae bacterium]